MFEVKEQSIVSTPAGSRPEAIKYGSQMSEAAADLVSKLNAVMLATDKVTLYQDWLKDFACRRMEDASYAIEAARTISSIEMKLSVGLRDKQDQQAAKAV